MVTIGNPLDGVEAVSRALRSCRSAAIIINATITRDDPTCKLLNPPPLGSFLARVRITVGAIHRTIHRSRGWKSTGDVIVAAKSERKRSPCY